jgi:hypothetical protein
MHTNDAQERSEKVTEHNLLSHVFVLLNFSQLSLDPFNSHALCCHCIRLYGPHESGYVLVACAQAHKHKAHIHVMHKPNKQIKNEQIALAA